MTRQKTFKHDVRDRMAKTGERYTAARKQLTDRADRMKAGAEPSATPQHDATPEPTTSEEAIRRATGRGWDEWFAILDQWGAKERKHGDVARWLVEERGVGGWWAQSVTVSYERARGLRAKHEMAGGYAVSVNKTVAADAERSLAAFMDPGLREQWLPDARMTERSSRAAKSARFNWGDDGSRVVVGVDTKGERKTQVSLQHEKLPDAETAERMKAFWRERLSALKKLLES